MAQSPGQPPALLVDGAVATLTLRRPQVANRLELDDLDRMLALLDEVNARPDVRVLRLQGEGRHFCSGFNIGRFDATGGVGTTEGATAGSRFEQLADAIEQARPITVAVLQGGAYGGAVDLAVACDFRLGTLATEAMVPATRLGLHFYRGGLERMVTRFGLVIAKRVLLAAEKLDAPTLLGLGLLDRIVAPDALQAEADATCRHLAGLAPLALLPMKQHMNRIARGTLDAEALARDIAMAQASDDLREGARAWADKRDPVFRGR